MTPQQKYHFPLIFDWWDNTTFSVLGNIFDTDTSWCFYYQSWHTHPNCKPKSNVMQSQRQAKGARGAWCTEWWYPFWWIVHRRFWFLRLLKGLCREKLPPAQEKNRVSECLIWNLNVNSLWDKNCDRLTLHVLWLVVVLLAKSIEVGGGSFSSISWGWR